MLLAIDFVGGNAYFYIALAFTTFFLLQGVFTFIGIGDAFEIDADFDAEIDVDVDITNGIGMTLHLFSVRGIIAFFMMFGWTGHLLTIGDVGSFLTFVAAFISGTIMLFLVSMIYYFIMKLSQDGTLNKTDAIGKVGTVYIPIPNRNEGIGKVQMIVGGSLRTLDAIAKDKSIKTGAKVKVIKIENNMLEVEEIE